MCHRINRINCGKYEETCRLYTESNVPLYHCTNNLQKYHIISVFSSRSEEEIHQFNITTNFTVWSTSVILEMSFCQLQQTGKQKHYIAGHSLTIVNILLTQPTSTSAFSDLDLRP